VRTVVPLVLKSSKNTRSGAPLGAGHPLGWHAGGSHQMRQCLELTLAWLTVTSHVEDRPSTYSFTAPLLRAARGKSCARVRFFLNSK
jgi:hypothetical protein